jgi:hypothetical protein
MQWDSKVKRDDKASVKVEEEKPSPQDQFQDSLNPKEHWVSEHSSRGTHPTKPAFQELGVRIPVIKGLQRTVWLKETEVYGLNKSP